MGGAERSDLTFPPCPLASLAVSGHQVVSTFLLMRQWETLPPDGNVVLDVLYICWI